MTALAMDVRELSFEEVDEVAGGPAPIAAAIGIRAGVGGLITGGAAFANALRDGEITQDEVGQVGIAFVAGALSGAAGGIFSKLKM